jgi:hypothetical protein
MTVKSLSEQVREIDQAMCELDDRRSALVHRMSISPAGGRGACNILQFPSSVLVRRAPRGSVASAARDEANPTGTV